jgi:transposase-like protein
MKVKEICPHCDSNKTVKSGRYRHKRNRNLIQKYKCQECNSYFSDQTLSKTCGQKRPDLNQKIMEHICGGVGILRTASILKTTKTTVQRKIKFLASVCDKFHQKYMTTWTKEPSFQFDELETCEAGRYYTVGVPVVVETKSHFLVGSKAQYWKSRCQFPLIKEKHDSRHKEEIARKDEITKDQIAIVRMMKPDGHIKIDTDGHKSYPSYMKDVFGEEIEHTVYVASDDKNKDRLFSVNNIMACLRADVANLRIDTWHVCKDIERLSERLKIYTFYSNYFKKKIYSKTWKDLEGKKHKKVLSVETPAMKLGIFDSPVGVSFLLSHI